MVAATVYSEYKTGGGCRRGYKPTGKGILTKSCFLIIKSTEMRRNMDFIVLKCKKNLTFSRDQAW